MTGYSIQCFDSVDQPKKRHVVEADELSSERRVLLKTFDDTPRGAYIMEHSGDEERMILPRTTSMRTALASGLAKRGGVPPTPGFLNCPA